MLTRREFLKVSTLFLWLSTAVGNLTTSLASHMFCPNVDQPWVYPLAFPAYFPIRPGASAIKPKPTYKQYLPIVSKNG